MSQEEEEEEYNYKTNKFVKIKVIKKTVLQDTIKNIWKLFQNEKNNYLGHSLNEFHQREETRKVNLKINEAFILVDFSEN